MQRITNHIQKKYLKFVQKNLFLLKFLHDYKSMISQGIKISTWGKNVYVKVPVVNSKNKFMGKVIKELNNKNIKLNITAVIHFKTNRKNFKKNK